MDSDVNDWLNSMINKNPIKLEAPTVIEQNPQGRVLQSSDPAVMELLLTVDEWSFDIFALTRITGDRPLFHLGMSLFEAYQIPQTFHIDPALMAEFLDQVEKQYRKIMYHNSTHAADVLHALHYFIKTLKMGELVSLQEIFASIIAAAIHDVDHPGYNNAYMIATSSPLAIRYNDISVLENYHCAKGFEILNSLNLLASISIEKQREMRATICSMVLATDMANHFEYIAKFKNKINGSGLDASDLKDRQLILDFAIKCGDISNSSKGTDLCMQWATNIMAEFFRQGDDEKAKGIPVSMFMDRETTVLAKCQVGFIDYIVLPLYEVWDAYMNEEGVFPGITNIRVNREYWKKCLEVDS